MGVKGLWEILEQTGTPIPLEKLHGKILAVDISIWLNQAVKGYRGADGSPSQNAHILCILSRLSKLLHFGVKPVFVFDGGVPEVKRSTVLIRKRRRLEATLKSKDINHEVLRNVMMTHAVHAVSGKQPPKLRKNLKNHSENGSEDLFYLPPLDASSSRYFLDPNAEIDTKPHSSQMELDYLLRIEAEDAEIKSLPHETQYEILVQAREAKKYSTTLGAHPLPTDAGEFSDFQVGHLLKKGDITRRLKDLSKSMTLQVSDGIKSESPVVRTRHASKVEAGRLVSDENQMFVVFKTMGCLEEEHMAQETVDVNTYVNESAFVSMARPSKRKLGCFNLNSLPQRLKLSDDSDSETEYESPNYADPGFHSPSCSQDRVLLVDQHSRSGPKETILTNSEPFASASAKNSTVCRSAVGISRSTDVACLNESSAVVSCYADAVSATLPVKAVASSVFSTTESCSPLTLSLESGPVSADDQLRNLHCPSVKDDLMSPQCHQNDAAMGPSSHVVMETAMNVPRPQSLPPLTTTSKVKEASAMLIVDSMTTAPMEKLDTVLSLKLNSVNAVSEKPRAYPEPPPDSGSSAPYTGAWVASDAVNVPVTTSASGTSSSPESASPTALDDLPHQSMSMNITVADSSYPYPYSAPTYTDKSRDGFPTATQPGTVLPVGVVGVTSDQLPVPSVSPSRVETTEPLSVDRNSHLVQSGDAAFDCITGLAQAPAVTEQAPVRPNLKAILANLQQRKETLLQDIQRQERSAAGISAEVYSDVKELLRLFGVPYLVSPMEAEAQCAALNQLGLCDGVITNDCDVFLFGAHCVYRHVFSQEKHAEVYFAQDISEKLSLSRDQLICLGMLLGCDYFEGLDGVGPVTALEIIKVFPGQGMDCLVSFKKWLTDFKSGSGELPVSNTFWRKLAQVNVPPLFPSSLAWESFTKPTVDHSLEPLQWLEVDFLGLAAFLDHRMSWNQERIESVINPMKARMQLGTIERFFPLVNAQSKNSSPMMRGASWGRRTGVQSTKSVRKVRTARRK